MTSALDLFSAPTRAWFAETFGTPTPAQNQAWATIASGAHSLVVAPTGSGKTLAAFLWAIDRLAGRAHDADTGADTDTERSGTRIVYVSPLKALAVDIERNLQRPLAGIANAAARTGMPVPDITVGVRSGDTPQSRRRAMVRTPPDILITTPESLYLMLTSSARSTLTDVETVIVDEIHSVAGTKRGAHLALSLERLDLLTHRPCRRIGLSATARPHAEVARFLGGAAPVTTIAPPAEKRWDLTVRVPVDDMTDLSAPGANATAPGANATAPGANATAPGGSASIWPHIELLVADLVDRHSSTIVFCNSRRLTERLTARLNEVDAERHGIEVDRQAPPPAQLGSTTDAAYGASAQFARAHHGSVSKERRAVIEADLKAGTLRCVVATSSLELGIDMGAVDLVVHVESPPSVAGGLQRIGRAGHHVGDVSRGVLVPKHRADLLHCAVTADGMLAGAIESLAVVSNPLDVLAQQTIAATAAAGTVDVDEWFEAVRRSAPFSSLPRSVFDATLDMLAGRYPSDEFAELRPRVVWDRGAGTLTARPGAARLAVTSGGTIPDRGAFAVHTVGEGASRVGELDEEMVYESRVGDVFALGTSSWRITEITHDRVLVAPAAGSAGRLPFWHGKGPGRPAEFGAAIGAFTRAVAPPAGARAPGEAARARLATAGLDERASANLLGLLAEQRAAVGAVPDDATLVVERFLDELGDWRVVLHSPYGRRVHAPWALAVGAQLSDEHGIDAHPAAFDDGIVLRLPATTGAAPGAGLFAIAPAEIDRIVSDSLGGSALFASRFRECAARALLLPRRDPGRRAPLWQQRHRSAQLLGVARRHPEFPILHETVRECMQDVYDLPALRDVLARIDDRAIRLHEAETPAPSPFASTLLFDYVAAFIYDDDVPLAERKAAALSLDPGLLAQLLGEVELSALLDPDVLRDTEDTLQWRRPQRRIRDAEALADALRMVGPLTEAGIAARADGDPAPWLRQLADARRIFRYELGGARWAVVEDAPRLRDGLAAPVPSWLPPALAQPVADPLGDLVGRYARTHGPFTADEAAAALPVGVAVAAETLERLAREGRVVRGRFRPSPESDTPGAENDAPQWCDADVLRTLRRRSLERARARLAPVPTTALGRFLPQWQHVGRPAALRGVDGLFEVIDQLAGAALPASGLEALILPARVADYRPELLDELTSSGEVFWTGCGRAGARDGWVALHTTESAATSVRPPAGTGCVGDAHAALLSMLDGGGAFFFRPLADAVRAADAATDADVLEALWELVWQGHVTGDTLAPLRALLSGAASGPAPARAGRTRRARPARPRPSMHSGPAASGRWSLVPTGSADPTIRLHDTARRLLDRYGVLTPGVAAAEGVVGGFSRLYPVLSRFEEAGHCRRGYVIDGLGGAQFAAPEAIDLLRAAAVEEDSAPLVLAAADPANPYGAAVDWPRPHAGGHRPSRAAGAVVVLVDGAPQIFVERGGRSILTFSEDQERIVAALSALAAGAPLRAGARRPLVVTRWDGESVHGNPHAAPLADAGFRLTPRGYRAAW
ncbi:ATP-dependent helicase [Tomitella fengzijianii]|uniref:ATP-dependent helicase n=1 Tax=Tomitella fengzijianii TaxID=2597660 RepID=UPI00355913B2